MLLVLLAVLPHRSQAFRLSSPYFDHRQVCVCEWVNVAGAAPQYVAKMCLTEPTSTASHHMYTHITQSAFAQLVVAQEGTMPPPIAPPLWQQPPEASSNQGLMTAMAGFLREGQPPQHLARLLETATAGVGVATGTEWVLFALLAARLSPQIKASPVGARFLAALVQDLPGRLEMLEPAQLVSLLMWPGVRCRGMGMVGNSKHTDHKTCTHIHTHPGKSRQRLAPRRAGRVEPPRDPGGHRLLHRSPRGLRSRGPGAARQGALSARHGGIRGLKRLNIVFVPSTQRRHTHFAHTRRRRGSTRCRLWTAWRRRPPMSTPAAASSRPPLRCAAGASRSSGPGTWRRSPTPARAR